MICDSHQTSQKPACSKEFITKLDYIVHISYSHGQQRDDMHNNGLIKTKTYYGLIRPELQEKANMCE